MVSDCEFARATVMQVRLRASNRPRQGNTAFIGSKQILVKQPSQEFSSDLQSCHLSSSQLFLPLSYSYSPGRQIGKKDSSAKANSLYITLFYNTLFIYFKYILLIMLLQFSHFSPFILPLPCTLEPSSIPLP